MEVSTLIVLKFVLIMFASLGIIFHLMAFSNPESGRKMEQALGTEFGPKKQFVPWLEKNRMGLHERLITSRAYNVIATVFLIALLILLWQI